MLQNRIQHVYWDIRAVGSYFSHSDLVKNRPRSNLDSLVGFWPNTSGPEEAGVQKWSGLVLAEYKQPAVSFLLPNRIVFFHRWPRSLYKTSFHTYPDQMQIRSSMFTGMLQWFSSPGEQLLCITIRMHCPPIIKCLCQFVAVTPYSCSCMVGLEAHSNGYLFWQMPIIKWLCQTV